MLLTKNTLNLPKSGKMGQQWLNNYCLQKVANYPYKVHMIGDQIIMGTLSIGSVQKGLVQNPPFWPKADIHRTECIPRKNSVCFLLWGGGGVDTDTCVSCLGELHRKKKRPF